MRSMRIPIFGLILSTVFTACDVKLSDYFTAVPGTGSTGDTSDTGNPDPDKNPVDTVMPPVDTVKPPVDTVTPPIDTVKPPVDTVKPPVDTVKPPVDTVKPPVDTVKPPVDTVKPPVDTVKPPVDTVKPPVDTVKPPVDTVKPPVDTVKPPVDTVKPPPSKSVWLRSDLEDQSASCWSARSGSCGTWSGIGGAGSQLAVGKASHSGSKSIAITFTQNEEVAGASLPLDAEVVNVRAWYYFDTGYDFGQGVKIGRVSAFNSSTQLNDIDIILAVRSSGSANQCGITDMSDLSLLFNGRPVGFDWGSISHYRGFQRNRWYAVEYQVKLNTPGQKDGSVKLWVDGVLAAQKTGINIRGNGGKSVRLNRLRLGGWYSNGANGNSCRNPSQPSTMYVDDVAVGSDFIGLN